MLKLNVQIDKESLEEKPNKSKTIMVSGRITDAIWNVSVEELAHIVGNKGHTFLPAVLDGVRDAKHFVSQKIFALDFDGKISLEEFWDRAKKYEILPAFIYETLTSSEETFKFRAVFINDITVQDIKVAQIMIQLLRKIFPESDKSCTDVSRMFFGGKRLLFLDPDNKIDIWNLAIGVQAYMKDTGGGNYARNLQRFAKDIKVATNKNTLCIHKWMNEEMEDFERSTSNILLVNPLESSIFYVIESSSYHKTSMHTAPKRKANTIEGVEMNMLSERCRLCKDFFEMDLSHDEKFLIATNLLQIKNGENIFFQSPIENVSKWEMTWKYNRGKEYNAQKCKNICPYYEECQARTIIDKVTNKIQKVQEFKYGDVRDSEKLLNEYLQKAICSNDRNIHLVKAQTAIGKTTSYCKLINEMPNKTFMIVLPTKLLQDEVAKRLKREGVEIYVTPNIKELTKKFGFDDLCNDVEELYNEGYGQKVKAVIKKFMKENEGKLNIIQKTELEEYLNFKEKFEGVRCIVTTHAMFLGLDVKTLSRYEIIVDEDILMTIFKNTSSITFEELETARKWGNLDMQCVRRISDLLDGKDGCAYKYDKITLTTAEVERIYNKKLNIRSSLVDFLQADSYYVDQQKEEIGFFCARKIPDVKMTVVSATLIGNLYEKFCGSRTIRSYDVPIAKYQGKLKQYTAHSLSRSNIEQIGLERLHEGINNITRDPEIVKLTFKKFSDGGQYYYGNTEGLNKYEGKDLAVIGTPHGIPFIYKLIGVYLGFNVEDRLCRRFVENNGYRFKIMTYGDENMRMLQFYFIESTIEQTIGRARLLRYDCTVYLFSNFPVRQAELIQEDYLIAEDVK